MKFEGVSFSLQTEVQNVLRACACRVVWGSNQGFSNRVRGWFESPWLRIVHRAPESMDTQEGVVAAGPPIFAKSPSACQSKKYSNLD